VLWAEVERVLLAVVTPPRSIESVTRVWLRSPGVGDGSCRGRNPGKIDPEV
jgi:hypothetical protein